MASRSNLFVMQVERYKEGYPNTIFITVPEQLATEFEILHKKLETSVLNNTHYLPKWGRITRLLQVKGSKAIEAYSDDIQPISCADWANILLNQLHQHMGDEESQLPRDIEDELIFFIGELTLLRDGTI